MPRPLKLLLAGAALATGLALGWWVGGTNRPVDLSAIDPHVVAASQRFGVEPALIRAVIRAESGGRPGVVSGAGAIGLMQLMPATAAELATELRLPVPDTEALKQPGTNIMLGTAHLARLLEQFDHDTVLACAAYNTGAARVRSWLRKAPDLSAGEVIERFGSGETRTYVQRVQRFRGGER